jgi:hypothetical protein
MKKYQEDCGLHLSGGRHAMEIVICVAIEYSRLMLNAGIRDGIDWWERHDAMQATPLSYALSSVILAE